MKWIPKIVYNTIVELPFTLAQLWWDQDEQPGFADEDEGGAGVLLTYIARWDYFATVKLRFTDDERIAVMTFLEWILTHQDDAFTFQFNKDDVATAFSVYLDSDALSKRVRPTRVQNAPWTWEISFTIRSANGTRIHVPILAA
jgi:hypothetical protein